ncbi:hypothetical protein ACFOYW_08145 [Gryllotalpicola reticulitermitis]|uniref:Transferase n=1 Tax=Gryllotalpicola reticulitermitis TaxID=1184153 RepID=A0ABV8Q7C4_9MICO
MPHPIGVVLGSGARIGDRVSIYQGVTVGANRRGQYPVIEFGVTLYPGSSVTGGVRVGAGALIGAGARIYDDVPAGATIRG